MHLLQVELHEEAGGHGHRIAAGDLGENVLTSGVDLLSLPRDTRLHLGVDAVVRVTGLRNPCRQIEAFRTGLLALATDRDEHGGLVRKLGMMGVVERGGLVRPGDPIRAELPLSRASPWTGSDRASTGRQDTGVTVASVAL
ncbi:hypothetical protein BH24ACT8_BH24ACT8_11650 [soil metagenome]